MIGRLRGIHATILFAMAIIVAVTAFSSIKNDQQHHKIQRSSSVELTERLMTLSLSHLTSAALKAFVELNMANYLDPVESTTVAALLRSCLGDDDDDHHQWNADAVLRVLRVLAVQGVVRETDKNAFLLTPLGELLRSEGPSSMVSHWTDDALWRTWMQLPLLCRHRETKMFEEANQMSLSSWYNSSSDSLHTANQFIGWIGDMEDEACVRDFDWSSLNGKTVLELGGHHGKLLSKVSKLHPAINFYCLDLPEVVHAAAPTESSSALRFWGGDLFNRSTWPPCDAIFMKHIVFCDWDDDASLQILRNCASHLKPGGLLFVGEACVDTAVSRYTDLLMLLGERDRAKTTAEWNDAALMCGFQIESVKSSATPTCSLLVLRRTNG